MRLTNLLLTYVTYILSGTVSQIWQINGPVYTVYRGVLLFNALVLGVNGKIWDCRIWYQDTRNIPLSCG